jgi:hypothetical protein
MSRQMRSGGPTVLDPESRTYAATLVRMRRAEERYAELLRGRGWICLPPGTPVQAGGLVDVPLPMEGT